MCDLLPQHCPFADCGRSFEVPAHEHGRAVVCPGCGRSLTAMHPETVVRHEAERLRREIAAARTGTLDTQAHPAATRRRIDGDFVALIENVRSLWNVGSIFRTADGAGISRLVLAGITGRPPRKEITKTALGADEVVEWQYEPDPPAAARELQADGYRLLALETGEGSMPWEDCDPGGRICLVVGHEVAGISPALCEMADQRVALPMRGIKESLNVAVAFGIAAYQLAAVRGCRADPEPNGSC